MLWQMKDIRYTPVCRGCLRDCLCKRSLLLTSGLYSRMFHYLCGVAALFRCGLVGLVHSLSVSLGWLLID